MFFKFVIWILKRKNIEIATIGDIVLKYQDNQCFNNVLTYFEMDKEVDFDLFREMVIQKGVMMNPRMRSHI
jgi:hypothetical protein